MLHVCNDVDFFYGFYCELYLYDSRSKISWISKILCLYLFKYFPEIFSGMLESVINAINKFIHSISFT